jgi:hypothetical protein
MPDFKICETTVNLQQFDDEAQAFHKTGAGTRGLFQIPDQMHFFAA